MDLIASKSALVFSSKWLRTTNIYVNLVLPNNLQYKMNELVRVTKEMSSLNRGNFYVSFVKTMSKEQRNNYSSRDIIWFPYEKKYYSANCNAFYVPENETASRTFFLLFTGTDSSIGTSCDMCKIRFDSNIVVYYHNNTSNSPTGMEFQEIYKIKENGKIKTNILGEIDLTSKHYNLLELNNYIWKRRSNLNQEMFTALTERGYPFIEDIELKKKSNGETAYYPIGYYPDIMNLLMTRLNFTIYSAVPKNEAIGSISLVRSIKDIMILDILSLSLTHIVIMLPIFLLEFLRQL